MQNASSAQGMIRREKLRRRNTGNVTQSGRGIDIEKEQEKECERQRGKEREKELDREQEKEKHRSHRDDQDDRRREDRRDDRPGERGDHKCDDDCSAHDRSSHPHHGLSLESSSDDDDEGWTKYHIGLKVDLTNLI